MNKNRNTFKKFLLITGLCATCLLCSCSQKEDMSGFKDSMNTFCDQVAKIDVNMNNINAKSDTAKEELLNNLDQLKETFTSFTALDFPSDFDYLEAVRDEAGDYMNEAVDYFHKAYEDASGYRSDYAEYAQQNYERAWKRIQIIIAFLHGETPEDVDIEIG